MATWRKVIVSGSNAQLNTVTASSALQVGTNQVITTTQAGTYLTGSFTGSFYGNGTFTGTVVGTISAATSASVLQITDDQTSNLTKYITFVSTTGGYLTQSIDSTGLTYNPSTNIISATASLALTASNVLWSGISNIPSGIVSSSTLTAGASQGQITYTSNSISNTITVTSLGSSDTPSFASIGASAASFNLATGTAATITIGSTTSTASFQGNVIIGGGLTVNGTTTIVNTTNLTVKDQFILLASGSTGNVDGGIIVGNSTTNYTGEALYWENSSATNATGRWAIASNIDASSTSLNITANSYLVTVSGSTSDPAGSPAYGSGSSGIGNMYVNTSTSDIWIWA